MSLIFGSMLGGLGAGVMAAGDTLEKERILAAERADRAEQRRLDREAREALQREQIASREQIARENAELRRDMKSSRRSGGGGGGDFDSAEGSQDEEMLAAKMGMTLPEFRNFRKAQAGDTSGFAQDAVVEDESGGHVSKQLPAGFDKFMETKRSEFSAAMEQYRFAKSSKDLAEGQGQRIENEVDRSIVDSKTDAARTDLARTKNAMSGKGEYKANESGVTNEFTGTNTPTDLGKAKANTERSKQGENAAQTRAADALAENRRKGDGEGESRSGSAREAANDNNRLGKLTTDAKRIQTALDNTKAGSPRRKELEADLASTEAEIRRLRSGGAKAEQPSGKSVVDALPKGARVVGTSGGKKVYETPDGKRYIEK